METDEKQYEYIRGNATLRSSSHTLSHSKSRKLAPAPRVSKVFPTEIRCRDVLEYNALTHNFSLEILRILRSLNPELVGSFHPSTSTNLEDFHVPLDSLRIVKRSEKEVDEAAQCLTMGVANDTAFMNTFDSFLWHIILPYFKERLHRHGLIQSDDSDDVISNKPITFYYQRPPTLRIQPGPSSQSVLLHRDADYGHQDGELNFWMPLTHRSLTQTELWCESEADKEDYTPVEVNVGQIAVFHGSSCRHYVPNNKTRYTRVSLDFRVGIEEYFDPNWMMRGTKHDHCRKAVEF